MKKIGLVVIASITLLSLAACGGSGTSSSTSTSTSSTQASSSSATSSKSSSSASSTSSSSSSTIRTSSAMNSDLGKARLALYEQGIDSSSITDKQLLKYWDAAKAQNTDFVQYVLKQEPSLKK